MFPCVAGALDRLAERSVIPEDLGVCLEHGLKVTEGPPIQWVAMHSLDVGVGRLDESTQTLESDPEVLVCVVTVGIHGDRGAGLGHALGERADLVERVGQVVVREIGNVRIRTPRLGIGEQ